MIGVYDFVQVFSKLLEAEGVEEAFEDGVLDARTKGLYGFFNATEAFWVGDVVADEKALAIHGQKSIAW